MLAFEIHKILTVEEWVKFKAYANTHPQFQIETMDGVKYTDYMEKDLHDFLVTQRILEK